MKKLIILLLFIGCNDINIFVPKLKANIDCEIIDAIQVPRLGDNPSPCIILYSLKSDPEGHVFKNVRVNFEITADEKYTNVDNIDYFSNDVTTNTRISIKSNLESVSILSINYDVME